MYVKSGSELIFIDDDFASLMHYGVGHLDGGRSGRYPWGSGSMPFQHPNEFQEAYRSMAAEGMTEKQIADKMGLTLNQLRTQKTLARSRVRGEQVKQAKELYSKYQNYTKVAEMMGLTDNGVRSLLNATAEANMNKAQNTADILMGLVKEKGMIDVGAGANVELGVSKEVLRDALYICYLEGYDTWTGGVSQVTNKNQQTIQKVLCPPGSEHKDIYDFENVHTIKEYHSEDNGDTFNKLMPPVSIDSKRIKIIYDEEGGSEKDGVIELRRGVDDISLGGSNYAQVRIAVDGTHYLKGMALYSDNIPDGYDIVFNTNKKAGTPITSVLKEMKTDKDGNIDMENPFGANIKDFNAGGQHYYEDKDGKLYLSAINKVRDEGDWSDYSKSLSSQFLAKQPLQLINQQLKKTYDNKKAELDEIISLTNPTVKKKLLLEYADECDGTSIHLEAAAMPRQSWKVVLPIKSLKDNEAYCPDYKTGEEIILIRYPHGGTFEIPRLTVNNEHKEAKSVLDRPRDAIGINSKVASILSGADFDGDTVIVIPVNEHTNISTSKPLNDLENFDPKASYKIPYDTKEEGKAHGYKYMEKSRVQNEMGQISNLITDMTIQGATEPELARAVKHSMVVIDAYKHGLDYTRSFKENNIKELKDKYQGHINDKGNYSTGAATIISRAKSSVYVDERKGNPHIDEQYNYETNKWEPTGKNEGKLYYKNSNREYILVKDPHNKKWVAAYEKDGDIYYKDSIEGKYIKADPSYPVKTERATEKVPAMSLVDDAYKLSTGSPKENAYADFANKMKGLANSARAEYTTTSDIKYNASANKMYSAEVQSLNEKLRVSESNGPKERQAQRLANTIVAQKEEAYGELSGGERKKIAQRALSEARGYVGASRTLINITDSEWDAIQSGAVSKTTLERILKYAEPGTIKQLATPRAETNVSTNVANKINRYYGNGYTVAQIAEVTGLSVSTIYKYLE